MSLPQGARRGVPALEPVASDTDLPTAVDTVIIGGGIIGTSAAFFLARQGHRVLLCEKGRIGAEQSSRNWGWVRQMGRDIAELPLAIQSLRIWRGLADMGIQTGFRETGITYLAISAHDRENLADWERQGRAHNMPIRMLGRDEMASLLPGLDGPYTTALHTATDGRAEPAMAAPALAQAARREGAAIMTGCAVRGIETEAGKVSGVVTEHGAVRCSAVLVAGGAWSRLFLGNLGVGFPQLRIHGTVARFETAAALPEMPVGCDFAIRRRLDGGYTLARRNSNIAPITADSFALFTEFLPAYLKTWREVKLRVTAESLAELRIPRRWSLDAPSPFERHRVLDPEPDGSDIRNALACLRRAYPETADARVTHGWAGLIDTTPDAVPAIGAVPGHPGVFVASGFSGHGFGIGPGAGQLAAELVSGTAACVDPAPFSPARLIRATRQSRTLGKVT